MNATEFVNDAQTNNFRFINVSDRKLAQTLKVRHSRSGKIDKGVYPIEARGVSALAYAIDELGNVLALGKDGTIRQYI